MLLKVMSLGNRFVGDAGLVVSSVCFCGIFLLSFGICFFSIRAILLPKPIVNNLFSRKCTLLFFSKQLTR